MYCQNDYQYVKKKMTKIKKADKHNKQTKFEESETTKKSDLQKRELSYAHA